MDQFYCCLTRRYCKVNKISFKERKKQTIIYSVRSHKNLFCFFYQGKVSPNINKVICISKFEGKVAKICFDNKVSGFQN